MENWPILLQVSLLVFHTRFCDAVWFTIVQCAPLPLCQQTGALCGTWGEFITLGTLYNDMGIDWMEINCSRLPSKGNMEQLRMINTNLNWSFATSGNVSLLVHSYWSNGGNGELIQIGINVDAIFFASWESTPLKNLNEIALKTIVSLTDS